MNKVSSPVLSSSLVNSVFRYASLKESNTAEFGLRGITLDEEEQKSNDGSVNLNIQKESMKETKELKWVHGFQQEMKFFITIVDQTQFTKDENLEKYFTLESYDDCQKEDFTEGELLLFSLFLMS